MGRKRAIHGKDARAHAIVAAWQRCQKQAASMHARRQGKRLAHLSQRPAEKRAPINRCRCQPQAATLERWREGRREGRSK